MFASGRSGFASYFPHHLKYPTVYAGQATELTVLALLHFFPSNTSKISKTSEHDMLTYCYPVFYRSSTPKRASVHRPQQRRASTKLYLGICRVSGRIVHLILTEGSGSRLAAGAGTDGRTAALSHYR